jgi:hypothetical protein
LDIPTNYKNLWKIYLKKTEAIYMYIQTITKQNLIFFLCSNKFIDPIQNFSSFLDQQIIYYTKLNIYHNMYKRKKKNNTESLRPRNSAQVGPSALGPHGTARASLPLSVVTDERVPLVRPSSLQDADGATLPVSSFSAAHGGSAMTPAAVGKGLGPLAHAHQYRLTFANRFLPLNRALPPSFYLNRINGGRPP